MKNKCDAHCHQDIANIERVPAMCENTTLYQFAGINLAVFSTPFNILITDRDNAQSLSHQDDNDPYHIECDVQVWPPKRV